jgi:hypothetical protein
VVAFGLSISRPFFLVLFPCNEVFQVYIVLCITQDGGMKLGPEGKGILPSFVMTLLQLANVTPHFMWVGK